jgi:hypothetical protein
MLMMFMMLPFGVDRLMFMLGTNRVHNLIFKMLLLVKMLRF